MMRTAFGTGWRQVWACLFLLAIGGPLLPQAFSVIAVQLDQEFHPSRMLLMMAMTVMSGVGALLSPFLGTMMDRLSLRSVVAVGTGLLIVGYLVLSFTTSFIQVLLVYGLLMAPANMLAGSMAVSVLISRWFTLRRGAAIGIAISGVGLGGLLFPPVIQLLIDHFAWRGGLRIFALLVAAVAIASTMMIVNRPQDRGLHPDGRPLDPGNKAADIPAQNSITNREVLTSRTFWLTCLVLAIVTAGMKGTITNLAPLAVDHHIAPDKAALLVSLYAGCAFVSKLSFAAVADKVRTHAIMAVSLIGFAIGAACLTRADMGYGVIAAGVCFVGLFGGMMVPLQGYIVPRLFGTHVVGKVSGLLSFVTLWGLLSTPALFGLIYDMTGSYNAIFVVFAFLAVGATIAIRFIKLRPLG